MYSERADGLHNVPTLPSEPFSVEFGKCCPFSLRSQDWSPPFCPATRRKTAGSRRSWLLYGPLCGL